MKVLLLVLSALLVSLATANQPKHVPPPQGYVLGDTIHIQCLNKDHDWISGPTCHESKQEISFKYGQDETIQCGWVVSEELYSYLISIIQAQESWHCRVATNPGRRAGFVPFTIPLWGIVEKNHIHVDNHLNFIFHVDQGYILGAAAYPVRENAQETQVGTILRMHGAVRWFKRHGYEPYFGSAYATFWTEFRATFLKIFLVVAIIFVAVLNAFIFFYWVYLKPRVVSKLDAAAKKTSNPKAIVQLPGPAAPLPTQPDQQQQPPPSPPASGSENPSSS